jgi:tRNA G26 N,N-dimethylase Trm1
MMKSFVHGKLGDVLAAVPQAHALRLCFDVLRSMILEQQAQVGTPAETTASCSSVVSLANPVFDLPLHTDELEKSVAEGTKNAEQLRDLKQKFGVTRSVVSFSVPSG